ncbi:MAG: hypothetical protein WD733_06405 [Bryobacterales bacterium]
MTLTIEIPDDEVRTLAGRARQQGMSPEQYAREILSQGLKAGRPRHISEVIRENMRQVPQEVLDQLPRDGASQHDRYLYGTPKRDP